MMTDTEEKGSAVLVQQHRDDNDNKCRDNSLDMTKMSEPSIKENKDKNDNTVKSLETCKESDTRKASKNLRFGIEAILKVKSDVTDRLAKRFSDERETVVNNTTDNGHGDNKDNYNEEECTDFIDAENIYDVDDKCFPYVRLPPSLHGVRPSEMTSLMTSQNILAMGAINSPWTSSIINGVRKERFAPVRRIGHPYQNRTPPKRKKPRTSFTRLQILELEKRFERQKYLASTERSTLAKSLKMSDAQVKTWFQNRRTKWRRQTAEERELERQAANRLLFSLQSDSAHRKSMVISGERMCLSHLQRLPETRPTDI